MRLSFVVDRGMMLLLNTEYRSMFGQLGRFRNEDDKSW